MRQRALVVDDHPIIRDGIKQLLSQAFPSIHIQDSSGGEGVMGEICAHPWNVVTLDINLSGQSGFDILRRAKTCCPQIPIVVFSMLSHEHYGLRALRTGAAAYVSKERPPFELVEAVKKVLRGEKQQVNELRPPFVLSERETEVLHLTAKGLNRKEIAGQLGINEKTVSTYRTRLLHKLNARTTVDLLRFALDEGLLERYK